MKFTIENTEKALEELQEVNRFIKGKLILVRDFKLTENEYFEIKNDLIEKGKYLLSVYDIKDFKPCGKFHTPYKFICSYDETLCPSCSKIKENLELIEKEGKEML